MKYKILLLALVFLALSGYSFAKPLADSVGVKNNDGKKMVLFKVKENDTYFSIGRRYNIQPKVLMKFNHSKKETLTIGAIIKVPTDIPYKKSKTKAAKEKAEAPKKESKKEKKARLAREAKEERAAKKHKHSLAQQNETPVDQAPERVVKQPVQPAPQPPYVAPVENNTPPTEYKVSEGETLYAISKRFNTTPEAIMKLNNLTTNVLISGQSILVRQNEQNTPPPVVNSKPETAKRDSVATPPVSNPIVIVNRDSSTTERHLNTTRYGLYEKNEKGVATWIDDPSLDPNKKLVLHRTAPIGTVIKITNTMTGRTTFAKVVGRFTDNEGNRDVLMVVTKNVADSLGALDKRFHVSISYGSPNE